MLEIFLKWMTGTGNTERNVKNNSKDSNHTDLTKIDMKGKDKKGRVFI